MAFVKIILLPLSVIYGVVTGVRNFLFHIGILKSQTFRIPVICVGNITVGGTGKNASYRTDHLGAKKEIPGSLS